MIIGQFVDGERIIIPLILRDDNEEEYEIEATLDTGFVGGLLLPQELAHQLQLPRKGVEYVILADGTRTRLPVYEGIVLWGEMERAVDVLTAVRDFPLVGIELLRGSIVHLELFDGGDITIEEDE